MKTLFMNILCILGFIYTPVYNANLYDIKLNSIDSIENQYIKIDGTKVAFSYNQNYLFTIDDCYYTYLERDKKIYIAYILNNSLYIKVYDDSGKNVYNSNNTNYIWCDNNIKLLYNNDKFYLFSSIVSLNNDILVYEYDINFNIKEEYIFSGTLNEEFIDAYLYNDCYYMVLSHDEMSNGYFINAGRFVLIQLSNEFEKIREVAYESISFQEISFNDDNITIIFNDVIYEYDLDLNLNLGFKLPLESVFTSKSCNCYYMTLLENKLEIYDIIYDEEGKCNKRSVLQTLEFASVSELNEKYLKEVKEIDNNFYLYFTDDYLEYLYKLELYKEDDFVKEITYLDGISGYNKTIENWFMTLKLECEDNNFTSEVNGRYTINYHTVSNEYSNTMDVIVLEEENVIDGMIYPLNYNLFFTGTAFLNNKMIHNNYAISEEGDYILELYSNKKEVRKINFKVSKTQIEFQNDTYKSADYEGKINQNITLQYKVNKENVTKVIVDGVDFKDFNLKDNVLSLNFQYDEKGFYIRKIEYIDDYYVNNIVTFNIYDTDPVIDFNLLEEKKEVFLNYQNEFTNLRLFNVYLDNTLYKTYAINDATLTLPINNNYNEVKLMLAYDIGDNRLYEKEIITILLTNTNKHDLAKIETYKQEEVLKEYKINLNNKDMIDKIKSEDKIIYEHSEDNTNVNYVLIILALIDICLMLYLFYIKYLRVFISKRKIKNAI